MAREPNNAINNAILIRCGEIALKGKNRINFENKLISNIEKATGIRSKRTSGRLILHPEKKDPGKISKQLRKVFGITSISVAKEISLDMEKIKEEALEQSKGKKFANFRITVQRLQKRLKTSPEIERDIGAFVVEKTGKKVKLKEPELEISIEIAENAYVFTERIKCFGGLPTGIEGNVALFFDNKVNGKKTILAGLLMMKRGCNVYPFSHKKQDTMLLEEYGSKPLTIIKNIDELEKEAENKNCRASVIGQTFEDLKNSADIETRMVVLKPLIGFDEGEARKRLGEFKR